MQTPENVRKIFKEEWDKLKGVDFPERLYHAKQAVRTRTFYYYRQGLDLTAYATELQDKEEKELQA